MFIYQNQFDTNQIFTQLGAPRDNSEASDQFVAYFGQATMESMQAMVPEKDGVLMASCLSHTTTFDVDGVSYLTALGDFFWGRNTTVTYDRCTSKDGMPCNPNCT